MEEIRINRLPLLTYRYLHTNDTPVSFEAPKKGGEPHFSDLSYVKEGGTLPADFKGASEETVKALKQGSHYTITIPAETKAELTITLSGDEQADFAGSFLFHLGKESSLNLIWILQGKTEKGTCVAGAYYDLAENANLKVSRLESGLSGVEIFDQRLHGDLRGDFTVIVTAHTVGNDRQQRITRITVRQPIFVVFAFANTAFLIDGELHGGLTLSLTLVIIRSSQLCFDGDLGFRTSAVKAFCREKALCGRSR